MEGAGGRAPGEADRTSAALSPPSIAPMQKGRTVFRHHGDPLHARLACLGFPTPVTAYSAHVLTFALTRTRSRDASIFIRDPASSTMPRDNYDTE